MRVIFVDLTRIWVYDRVPGGASMDIADLKRRKNNLRLSVAQLSFLAELPVGTVSKIMTGETQNPSFATIEILDKTLAREEQNARIHSFQRAMMQYLDTHQDERFIYRDFEHQYKEQYKLNEKAIPYATPDNDKYWIAGDMDSSSSDNTPKPEDYFTYEEFQALEESTLYELLDGKLIINPLPNVKHCTIVGDLAFTIDEYIKHNHRKDFCCTQAGVRFYEDPDTCLIPDIIVASDRDMITDDCIMTPDWIIEVTSPSSHNMDYKGKLIKYTSSGVREYWIVDLEESKVITWNIEDLINGVHRFNEEIPVFIFNGDLKIKLDDYMSP